MNYHVAAGIKKDIETVQTAAALSFWASVGAKTISTKTTAFPKPRLVVNNG
ncbi:hypothetical protein Q669_29650 [Labrenzia sp. C1B10]|uniref:hypothetical protein n=1 Tax=unclassified Labrenzia TaxID=2648686 RepID=UPI0003B90309|nr:MULTISPECIES: hypothetical protein [unclassified Labrenzia]ERP95736.1 hypothetical protein Q669_29650 [Labrenzia sp. C1B10]ERS05802.1 hypothetical protein Q675_29215 [Labrenzia sp. C1B70]